MSYVMCHVSGIKCQVSYVTCHVSLFFLLFLTKWLSLLGESVLSTGPTPSSFYSNIKAILERFNPLCRNRRSVGDANVRYGCSKHLLFGVRWPSSVQCLATIH